MNAYERIAATAASNDDLITFDELKREKISWKYMRPLLRRKVARRLHHGVYSIGAAEPTWRQRLRAAVLAAGKDAMPSHASFMALRGIDGAEEGAIEITVPDSRDLDLEGVKVYRSRRGLGPTRFFDGMKVPCFERALVDYAAVAEPILVERAVEHILRERWSTEEKIWRGLFEYGGRGVQGTVRLREVMEGRPEGRPARSILEILLGKVLDKAGLTGIRNHPVTVDGENFEIDRAFFPAMVALEADSRWHVTKSQTAADAVRQEKLERVGYFFVRTGWNEVVCHPEQLIARLRAALDGQSAA